MLNAAPLLDDVPAFIPPLLQCSSLALSSSLIFYSNPVSGRRSSRGKRAERVSPTNLLLLVDFCVGQPCPTHISDGAWELPLKVHGSLQLGDPPMDIKPLFSHMANSLLPIIKVIPPHSKINAYDLFRPINWPPFKDTVQYIHNLKRKAVSIGW